ncbi:MAG: DUF3426 domain-containing protein [Pseudomonadota bacterium]
MRQPPASLAGAHEAYRLKVRERRRAKSRTAALVAWASTATAFVAVLASLFFFREQVVRTWPESASTYSALGLTVSRFDLDFVETNAQRFFDGTTPILEVRGVVQNTSDQTVEAPQVRVKLLDDTGAEVARAFAPISPRSIPPEALANFTARIENPPFESFELELSLVPGDTALANNGLGNR